MTTTWKKLLVKNLKDQSAHFALTGFAGAGPFLASYYFSGPFVVLSLVVSMMIILSVIIREIAQGESRQRLPGGLYPNWQFDRWLDSFVYLIGLAAGLGIGLRYFA